MLPSKRSDGTAATGQEAKVGRTLREWLNGLTVRMPRTPLRDSADGGAEPRPLGLVLSGGGARGAAHIGVLRALEHEGLRPAAIVGVSMGAIVGATYALNPSWYRALTTLDLAVLPGITKAENGTPRARLQAMLASERALRHLLLRQGAWASAREPIVRLFEELTLGKHLEDSRLPLVAVATDLRTSERVLLTRGKASEAMYASAALAGVLPPLPHGDTVLADGAYADMAPVDVARSFGVEVVVVVDASPAVELRRLPRNGLEVLFRAMEVSHHQHALRRFAEADLLLKPAFGRAIDTLDFRHHRRCIAAGVRVTRAARPTLRALLSVDQLGAAALPRAV
jgi:NTE family protein